eukprot:scaffold2441_cov105-Cylindrotheca_fusiformis.AAC.4
MFVWILFLLFLLNQLGISFVVNCNKGRHEIFRPSLQPLNAESSLTNHAVQYGSLFKAIQEIVPSDVSTSSEATRIFHGRGGCFPGCDHLTLDLFPPVVLLTSHKIELSHHTVASIHDATRLRYSGANFSFVYQYRNDTGSDTQLLSGEIPKPHVVTENGMKFLVNLLSSKNHGIFLDMANGRTWVRQNTRDCNVLNMFAYTCGFSVAALSGGASQVVNIDMAAGPMKNGKRNHELNGLVGARFLTHNIFKTWGKLRKLGTSEATFHSLCFAGRLYAQDTSIPMLTARSLRYHHCRSAKRLPDLLTDNGNVLLCLNAPSLDTTWLNEQVGKEAPQLDFVERVPNPAQFQSTDPERALKVMLYKKRS